ncbi:MAG: Magnesium and cobalt efflux protein CorC [Candidatus Parcubacteria bacterium]|jgi:metal transporter CNNM
MEIILIFLLLALSALFSGLTIGLLSLDMTGLRIKSKQGDKDATAVLHVREIGTQLLVTLLLANTFVNSILAIVLADRFSGVIAGIVTTALIFFFGELLPQAALTRHALAFGSKVAPFVRGLIFIGHPITKPIAALVDAVLGDQLHTKYTKRDLLEIVADENSVEEGDVDTDERRIVRGSLSFSHKKVRDVLTPSTIVESVHIDDTIDSDYINRLKNAGYSRLPVQTDDRNQSVGILYLKDLLGVTLPIKVKDALDSTVHFVSLEDTLDTVLDEFIKTKMHLFIVLDEFGTYQGVVTLEDIVEEIIGAEIMDEDDEDPDLRAVARINKKKNKKSTT